MRRWPVWKKREATSLCCVEERERRCRLGTVEAKAVEEASWVRRDRKGRSWVRQDRREEEIWAEIWEVRREDWRVAQVGSVLDWQPGVGRGMRQVL
jgi:hypothetical protein